MSINWYYALGFGNATIETLDKLVFATYFADAIVFH
jgi:hypothetical protein